MRAAYPGDAESPISKKEGYARHEDTVVSFSHPERISIEDPLTEVLRAGARRLLAEAAEAEVPAFVAEHSDLVDEAGRRRVVRHGYVPEREVQSGIGAIRVRRPRVRDRAPGGDGPIRFTSTILPPYLRRAKSVEELLPWLYLEGISTGDFGEALAALLGAHVPGLSATTIARLKAVWAEEYERWTRRDLSARRYVHFWANGVYFRPRLDHDKQCLLVIIGADGIGNKDIVGLSDGYRESAQSWLELLLDLKRRGLTVAPFRCRLTFCAQLSDVGLDRQKELTGLARLGAQGFGIVAVVADGAGAAAAAAIAPAAMIVLPRVADFAAGFPSFRQRGAAVQAAAEAARQKGWSGVLLGLGEAGEAEHERLWPDPLDGLLCRPLPR